MLEGLLGYTSIMKYMILVHWSGGHVLLSSPLQRDHLLEANLSPLLLPGLIQA